MRSVAFAVSLAVLTVFAGPAQAREFSKIIVFGDSLSDIGNTAGVTRDGAPPRVDGYYRETHYSDNKIWIERVAKYLGMPKPKTGRGNTTSLPPRPNGTVWAWGGAEASNGTSQPGGATEPVPALLKQVNKYLDANAPEADALYVVWAGADNLLVGGQYTPAAAVEAATAVVHAMRKLQRNGAMYIGVVNLPDLALTPYARDGGRGLQTVARLYTVAFNASLTEQVLALRKSKNFDAKVYYVDAYLELGLISAIVDGGFTYKPSFFVPGKPVKINNVKDEGFEFYTETGEFPTGYLFWDGVHPTAQGHQIIAGKILEAID